MDEQIRILFDGPPGPESGRFIEVENEKGESISIGEWVQEGDMWYLEFPDIRNKYETLKAATEMLKDNEELAIDVFCVLTDVEIKTLGDQKKVCRAIASRIADILERK